MGFVKLPDDLTRWAWYTDNDTLAVYIRLVMGAAWTDTEYRNVILKRGQLAATIPKIAEQSGLTVRQTRTVLDRLKATGKIAVKQTNKFSIITLLEYDCNGETDRQNGSQMTVKRQASDSPTLLKTDIQTVRNTDNALTRGGGGDKQALESSFERFWSAYPKKVAKAAALKAWGKIKPDQELTNTILEAIEKHKQSDQWRKDGGQYIPNPSTWLNGKRWDDELKIEEVKTGGNNSTNTRSEQEWLRGFNGQ